MACPHGVSNTMTQTANFDELRNFCSSYFHEDWALDAETPSDVVSQFLADSPSATELRTIADQIRQFIDMHGDDARLETEVFEALGCYYQPSSDNVSARAWLVGIRSTMLSAASSAERRT
jgi:hypothetical protein